MKETLERELPQIKVYDLQGTYLLWIDLGAYVSGKDIKKLVVEECGLGVDFGEWFGGREYSTFIRVNLATKQENIETATKALIEQIKK
jgi:cystathionine beta-lyase